MTMLDAAGVNTEGAVERREGARDGASSPAEREQLERALIEMWRRILRTEDVGVDDSFFDLGGDSLRAARLFVELEDRWGIDRPISLLAEAPTVASLALALTHDPDWDSVLTVQSGGERPPLFVVHDGTGSVLYARGLADELGLERPIYGLRCEELNGEPLRASSFEELAATYIARIRRIRAHGPYLFYGASIGGLIGLEMARQLTAAGEEVPFVALGDSEAPSDGRLQGVPERLWQRLGDLGHLPAATRMRRFASYLSRRLLVRTQRALASEARTARRHERTFTRALKRGERVPLPARPLYIMREYERLLTGHRVRAPYPQRVLLLRTAEQTPLLDGWGALLGERLEIVDVPGSHADLGRERSGRYVGPILERVLGAPAASGPLR